MQEDSSTRAIVLKAKGPYFSRGTDYLSNFHLALAHLNSMNKPGTEEYFTSLYDLMYFIGRMETPFIPIIEGKALGSAACLSNLATFSIASPKTMMSFPETSFGFIPTGGATYHLSRLDGELGLYLALTGKPLSGSDAVHTKFAYNFSTVSIEFMHNFYLSVDEMNHPMNNEEREAKRYHEFRHLKAESATNILMKNYNEILNRTSMSKFHQDRGENVTMVYADLLYKMKVREDALKEAPNRTWRDYSAFQPVNHLTNFENSAFGGSMFDFPKSLRYYDDLKAIYRVFSANTLEEALERLREELSIGYKEWAQETFDNIAKKSPLALELTFRLIKEAKNLEWAECMKREHAVAVKLAKHPDFIDGAFKTLSRYPGVPIWSVNFPVPKELINEYLLSESVLELQSSKPNQFLPVKEWFKKIPNAPRLWLNQQSTENFFSRISFDADVRYFLRNYDIDVRDPSIDAAKVREAFWNNEMYLRKLNEELGKVDRLAEDHIARGIYINERKIAIEELFNNQKRIAEKVEHMIKKRFKNKIIEKIEKIRQKSTEARTIEKHEFFKETKQFVNEHYILDQNFSEEFSYNSTHTPDVPMHFPEDIRINYLQEARENAPKNLINKGLVKFSTFQKISDYKEYFAFYMPKYIDQEIETELSLKIDEMFSDLGDITKILEGDDSFFYDNIEKTEVSFAKPEEITYHKLPSELLKELKRELYIKTGINDIEQALEELRDHNFKISKEGMKARRIEIIREDLNIDDHFYHPDANKLRLKNLFSEFYISPKIDDLDESILEVLEVESFHDVLSDVAKYRKARLSQDIEVEEDNFDEDISDLKNEFVNLQDAIIEKSQEKSLVDLVSRMELDKAYLKAILGSQVYVPKYMNMTKEDIQSLDKTFGIADLSQSAAEWLDIALQRSIDEIFEERANLEINLTRAELIAYDKSIEMRLKPSNLKTDVYKILSYEAAIISKAFDFKTEEAEVEKAKISTPLLNLQKDIIKRIESRKISEA